MAQKTINTGTQENSGDGDPIRIAFEKVNENFTELYNDVDNVSQSGIIQNQEYEIDINGSVFANDSTLLVDGVNGVIPGANITGVIPGYINLNTLQIEVAASTDFADFQARIAALT